MKVLRSCLFASMMTTNVVATKPRVHMHQRGSKAGLSPRSADTCEGIYPEEKEGSAVYTMTNQPTNEIIVFSRSRGSGLLSLAGRVATGGAGGISANALPNGAFAQPTQGDPLGSQDSVIVAGRCLLAVNAGSDEISTFRIMSSSEIELAGKFPSGGTFPVSLTEKDGLVYVLNAGGLGSIQGFALTQFTCGLIAVQEPLSLHQDAVGSVPDFELASPAEIQFTPEGNILVVIKVDGGAQNFPGGPGSLNLFQIDPTDGTASYPITTPLSTPGSLPFSVDFDSQGRLLVAEAVLQGIPVDLAAGGGVTVWEYGEDGTYTRMGEAAVNEEGTCWIRYNPRNACTYVTNASPDGSISSIRGTSSGIELVEQRAASNYLSTDFTPSADGRFLYVLSSQLALGASFPGTGEPEILVYEMDCDCGLEELEIVPTGFDQEARIAADGLFNGFQALAVYN